MTDSLSLLYFSDPKWRKISNHKEQWQKDKKQRPLKVLLSKPRKERIHRNLKDPFSIWVWHFSVNKKALSQSSMRLVTKRCFKWIVYYTPRCRSCPHEKSWKHLASILVKRTNVPYIDIATYK